MSKTCAYCGKSGVKFTREHIIPSCLLKRTPEYIATYSEKAKKVFAGDLMISDVCVSCNNGELSLLDQYIGELYDQYFHIFLDKGDLIKFRYDWQLLGRWLLKISYNSARSSNQQVSVLKKFSPAILGKDLRPIDMAVFLDIVEPSVRRKKSIGGENHSRQYPEMIRCGRVQIPGLKPKTYILRMVAINSFYFYLVIPKRPHSEPDFNDLMPISMRFQRFHHLDPDNSLTVLTSSGVDVNKAIAPSLVEKIDLYKTFFDKHSYQD